MEDFVPYKLAVKLKEKGFREKVNAYYGKHENIFDVHPALDMNDADYRASAPTISQVLKWLREEKKLHIEIYMYNNCYLWDIYNNEIYNADFTQKSEKYSEIEYVTYELAALAGIKYVLDNLI